MYVARLPPRDALPASTSLIRISRACFRFRNLRLLQICFPHVLHTCGQHDALSLTLSLSHSLTHVSLVHGDGAVITTHREEEKMGHSRLSYACPASKGGGEADKSSIGSRGVPHDAVHTSTPLAMLRCSEHHAVCRHLGSMAACSFLVSERLRPVRVVKDPGSKRISATSSGPHWSWDATTIGTIQKCFTGSVGYLYVDSFTSLVGLNKDSRMCHPPCS